MNQWRIRSVVLVLIALVVTWGVYSHRVRIEAWLWHLRHGTSVNVGNYIVPVPVNWYVEDKGNGGQMLFRLDTDDRTPYQKLKWHASILLLPKEPMVDQDINRLISLDKDYLNKQGVDPILQRTFSAGDETTYCIGGDRLPSPPGIPDVFDAAPVSWHCKLAGGLDLGASATGPDMKQVWEIVAGIRKKS